MAGFINYQGVKAQIERLISANELRPQLSSDILTSLLI
jgi:hypothetical protein